MSCPLLQIPLALLNQSSIANKQKSENDQPVECDDNNNNNNTHQEKMNKISALIFSPSSDAVYIGDTDGMLTKLSRHDDDARDEKITTTTTTRKYRREWKIDAQCGAIQGISTCSNSNSAESFVAVFGKGDCCVNVFHERHQSSSPLNVLLRWQCTGHAFSVTAVQLVQLASSSSSSSSSSSTSDAIPLVVTASADGLIRLFDLQRTSTTSIATTISGGRRRSTNNNSNCNADHIKQQHQLVRSLCQTSLPHSLNVIPKMLLGKNDGTILVLCHEEENHNNNIINDDNCSTKKAGGTSDGIVLIHIDVLGSQRHQQQQQSHHHHFSSHSTSSSSSLIQNTDLKKEVRSTSDLLQVTKIVKLRELFPSPFPAGAATDNNDDISDAVHFISWNANDNAIALYDPSRSENSIFSSCNFEREERRSKIDLDESWHGSLFTLIQHNTGCTSRTVVDYISACERKLLHECLFPDDHDDEQNSKKKSSSSAVTGKTNSVRKPSSSSVSTAKQIISGVIAQHHLSKQSGTRRERDDDERQEEKTTSLSLVDVVERCKETLQLINELKSQ